MCSDLFGVPLRFNLPGSYGIETWCNRGAALQLLPRLAPDAGMVALRPRQYDTLAIVHRAGAVLSPAARLMIELATRRIQSIAEPVRPRVRQ